MRKCPTFVPFFDTVVLFNSTVFVTEQKKKSNYPTKNVNNSHHSDSPANLSAAFPGRGVAGSSRGAEKSSPPRFVAISLSPHPEWLLSD